MRVRSYCLSPAARGDIEAIVDYLRERNPVAAVRFVEAAQATFEHLSFAGEAHRKLTTGHPALAELRSRPLTGAFRRYLVFYRESEAIIAVVRVLHSARDLDSFLSGDE